MNRARVGAPSRPWDHGRQTIEMRRAACGVALGQTF